VDLEGKPAAKVTVRAVAVHAHHLALVDGWATNLDATVKLLAERQEPKDLALVWFNSVPLEELGIQISAVTDVDGRFRLTSLGAERVVELRLDRDDIVTQRVLVMTRPGERVQVSYSDTFFSTLRRGMMIYPAKFEHPVAPSSPVEGVVRDETGRPVAGLALAV